MNSVVGAATEKVLISSNICFDSRNPKYIGAFFLWDVTDYCWLCVVLNFSSSGMRNESVVY